MSLPAELNKIKEKLYVENEYGVTYQALGTKLTESERSYLRKNYGIDKNDELMNMCVNCQARQLTKYYGVKPTNDKEVNTFAVTCEGVKKNIPIRRDVLNQIMEDKDIDSESAKKFIRSTQDPVAWCYLMFGFDDEIENWRLRPYQKEQLRCNAERLVIREGRRSGKTFLVALKLLYLAFNKTYFEGYDSDGKKIIRGPEILIVTPYQSQITNIFNEMERILKRNSDLCSQISTGNGGSLYVKTPFFRMEFSNGAKISGFVSGVGNKIDGSAGGTIRGQNASVIYLDEMDMIPEEVLDKVIVPLLLTKDNVTLIATSTPIGKRAKFYKWCLERPDFKEDYYPSTVLPQWNKIKHEVLSENSEEGFKQEYMAEFIDGAHGVFKPSYVFAARQDYSYEDCENYNWWISFAEVREPSELIKVIGIDWNKNAGTEFVVVAYDPSKHFWFVVESTNISASEFSSIKWKEEVIRLNYKWKPHYIYADEGYGHTIIEDLKLLAFQLKGKRDPTKQDQETMKLSDKLISFNFSSKVELTSPVDGTRFDKSGKEYLVENAVRVFEDQRIWYPESDEVIRKQLLNYIVQRRSVTTNKPIYGSDNHGVGDHRLDALMLALAGLSLEFSIYARNSAPLSAPVFIDKETLDKRSAPSEFSALNLLKGVSTVDRNGRSSFNLEQEDFLKIVNGGRQTKSRADITKKNDVGILEQMMSRNSQPAFGRRRRSSDTMSSRTSRRRSYRQYKD